jgi:predicted house-cleaning noncanonical NTP pyrophosphatase (MazG superfamily)
MEKLVRDRIPELFGGKTRIASPQEYYFALLDKLREESQEVYACPVSKDVVAAELGDVLEVVRAIADNIGLSWEELEAVREKKKAERGAFAQRIMWSAE